MTDGPELEVWKRNEQVRLNLSIEQFDKIFKLAVQMDVILGISGSYYYIVKLIETGPNYNLELNL